MTRTTTTRSDARHYTMRDDGGEYELVAATMDEAMAEARRELRASYPRDGIASTVWVSAEVLSSDPDEGDDSVRVAIDPEEPDCVEDHEHSWCAPQGLVGGLAENPGVYGHGGGIISHEVCRHCGTRRIMDSWAQDPETGEQGLDSVRYEREQSDADWFAERGERAADEADLGDESYLDGRGAIAAAAYRIRMAERVRDAA